MIRTIWYRVTLIFLTIYYGLKVIVAALILRIPNRHGGVYDETTKRWSAWQLKAAGVKVRTVGFENIPKGRPVVFVSNHQSWFDIISLAATLPHTTRFLSKKELAKVPLLGKAMQVAGHIFLDRQNRQKAFAAYEAIAQVVSNGMNAVVFAEGTRSRTGELQPFKKGPFVLAIAAQVPVVPVYCAHTFGISPKGSIRIHPRPVTLYFGKPISTEGMTYEERNELLARVRAVIEQFSVDAARDSH
ncbi:MAG: lysophospholipid acyltransferase family protein [Gemmatimonadales bacterium]